MKGTLLKIFHVSRLVENKLPVNFNENDIQLFASAKKIQIPQNGLYLLRHVFVTDLGIIYKNLRAVKENITCYEIDFKKYRYRYFLKSLFTFKKFSYKGNKALIVFDNYSGPKGFAHWICDGLTRLAEMNDVIGEYTLIVPAYFKDEKIYGDSLDLFDIKKIHYLPKNSFTYFNELYFPEHVGDTGNFHPENIKKLRAIVDNKVGQPQNKNKNIYISRAKATRRFVENEKELLTLLTIYNFDVVYMEDHSIFEQIKIIKSAAHIVSIHGAALTLIAFANENASVLELRSKTDSVNNMYYLLATACGLNYYYLSCESSHKTASANNFNLEVNVTDLKNTLTKMLSATT